MTSGALSGAVVSHNLARQTRPEKFIIIQYSRRLVINMYAHARLFDLTGDRVEGEAPISTLSPIFIPWGCA